MFRTPEYAKRISRASIKSRREIGARSRLFTRTKSGFGREAKRKINAALHCLLEFKLGGVIRSVSEISAGRP